jgi:hypothetical protein
MKRYLQVRVALWIQLSDVSQMQVGHKFGRYWRTSRPCLKNLYFRIISSKRLVVGSEIMPFGILANEIWKTTCENYTHKLILRTFSYFYSRFMAIHESTE